ncbi:MAG: hypothetical protein HYV97_10345 [Bdellovibrio sp.]|nr:hypothetical protein [Bdellovibrio sp.]
MKEILALIAMAWCFGLVNIVQADHDCQRPVGFVCDLAQLNQYRLSLDLNRQQLKNRFDDRPSIDHSEVELAIEEYRRDLNELRSCQRTLGATLTSCHLSLNVKNSIGGKYFLRETVINMTEVGGECLRSEEAREQEIINDTGKSIANSLNGHWIFQHVAPTCQSNGASGASTTRIFTLRGYDEAYPNSKGYFQLIDWAESDSYDYQVSQQWARQIQMGQQTTLAVRGEDKLIKFEFSNGAYLALDGDSDTIVDSNFLAQEHFISGQCRTNETQSGSGSVQRRARFSPQLNLSAPYNNLPVKTIKN